MRDSIRRWRAVLLAMALASVAGVPARAKDLEAGAPAANRSTALQAVRSHLRHLLGGKFARLDATYAGEVELLPGHEFLKEEYELLGGEKREKGARLASGRLIAAMEKAFKGRPIVEEEVLEKLWARFAFEEVEGAVGDVVIDPPDPVGTPDGKLHFTMVEGDVLYKVGPKKPAKGDYLLFQVRELGDGWRIVAEYLD